MRYQGKITDWKDDKGFGFVTPNGGGPRVFVHIKSFSSRQRRRSVTSWSPTSSHPMREADRKV